MSKPKQTTLTSIALICGVVSTLITTAGGMFEILWTKRPWWVDLNIPIMEAAPVLAPALDYDVPPEPATKNVRVALGPEPLNDDLAGLVGDMEDPIYFDHIQDQEQAPTQSIAPLESQAIDHLPVKVAWWLASLTVLAWGVIRHIRHARRTRRSIAEVS